MNKKQKKSLRNIIISGVLLILVTVLTKIFAKEISSLPDVAQNIILLCLNLIPYLIVGLKVLKKAGKNILHGHVFDENFLMTLATIGAFALGEYTEATAVMLFYQIGELFENIAVNKSRTAIKSLVKLRPDYTNVLVDGNVTKVDPYDVAVDDEIIVLPGERIPLDGVVTEGESFINTAALTGESVPRGVKAGDTILSGCINEQGKLIVKVTKEFEESTVSKILDMVENASTKKSRSESFISRFARYYTPFVVFAAVAFAILPPIILSQSFLVWIKRALIFLVISCPCALVISVPLGFFGGIGAASKHGILVKGSNYLELMAKANVIVFDKTGTLTKGVFEVISIKSLMDKSEENLLKLAAYAEYYSNHPIGISIKNEYEKRGNTFDTKLIEDTKEIAGKGISLKFGGEKIYVGNDKLLADLNINTKDIKIEDDKTVCYVADDKQCLGYILIADVVKDTSKAAIEGLKKQGVKKTVMLSGDRSDVANAVADELGIDEVYSELLPDNKLSKLEEILASKSANAKTYVGFVGDGINDAPSLVRADIGIAMGALGQDAAIEAADIVLMDDNPKKIALVSMLGRKTLRIVKENVVFALGVKLLAMVLGVLGIAGMWFAVFADVGVSVLAILNSMRMLRQ